MWLCQCTLHNILIAIQFSNRFNNGCTGQINTSLKFCWVADHRAYAKENVFVLHAVTTTHHTSTCRHTQARAGTRRHARHTQAHTYWHDSSRMWLLKELYTSPSGRPVHSNAISTSLGSIQPCTLQLVCKDYSFIYQLLSVSFIHLGELWQCRLNEIAKVLKQQQEDLNLDSLSWEPSVLTTILLCSSFINSLMNWYHKMSNAF